MVQVATVRPRAERLQVNADRTVTLRFRAPNAKEVVAIGEIDGKDHPMTKDAAGLWSVTLGPLAPDIYNYQFRVDGVVAMDPQNPQVTLGFGAFLRCQFQGSAWRRTGVRRCESSATRHGAPGNLRFEDRRRAPFALDLHAAGL